MSSCSPQCGSADVRDPVVTEEDLTDGYSLDSIFESLARCNQSAGIEDLIILPGSITFSLSDVDLQAQVSRNYSLRTPLCSAPMDTVTEHDMAIGMALNGGMGFIHCKCGIVEQIEMIRKVKSYENGFILDPVVLSPESTLEELNSVRKARKIRGVPVTVDGKMGSRLVGLVSNRDTDFLADSSMRISDVMTPLTELVTGRFPITIEEAHSLLKDSKKGYLPIVDEFDNLRALTTRTDLKKKRDFPLASKDACGTLIVGGAVPANPGGIVDFARIDALVEAGCNIIVLDSLNGDNEVQTQSISYIKGKHRERQINGYSVPVDIIAGNVVRASQAKQLLEMGVDGLRVGMGVCSVTRTQLLRAMGRPLLSSIYYCAKIAREYGVPVIADGALRNTGSLVKVLTAGANCIMMGSLLAGVDESPGEFFFQNGKRMKHYRASTIDNTPNHDGDPTFGISGITIASGISGTTADKGNLHSYIPFLAQSIRHGFQDIGVRSILENHEQVFEGLTRFEVRSASAQKEGGVHDIYSYSQIPYSST